MTKRQLDSKETRNLLHDLQVIMHDLEHHTKCATSCSTKFLPITACDYGVYKLFRVCEALAMAIDN